MHGSCGPTCSHEADIPTSLISQLVEHATIPSMLLGPRTGVISQKPSGIPKNQTIIITHLPMVAVLGPTKG